MKVEVNNDGTEIVVTIPMCLRRRGGRKLIIAPEGMAEEPPTQPRDANLAKLVAKAHRWLKMLESGQFASITELAEHEKMDRSYLAKILKLTLLAPDIIEAILDDRHPDVLTWRVLSQPFPMLWEEQREMWGLPEL
ncbi:MAG: hypothetical protein HQL58_12945 [Magnetococcales bacterium]|nr:hypothetical protein [Magnetococcales bacterium]